MSDKLDRRCPCTMQKKEENLWIKAHDGYFDPDPDCKECKGKGSIHVTVDVEAAEAIFVGVCPICGEENGVHFQLPGMKSLQESNYPPCCMNQDCSNSGKAITWVERK